MQLAVILAVGNDFVLLSTRAAILISAGYVVDTVESVPEAIARFHDGDFDLVLVCHSVEVTDREHLIRAIRSSGSHTPILLVSPLSETRGLVDRVVDNHPAKLLSGIEAALLDSATRYRRGSVSHDSKGAQKSAGDTTVIELPKRSRKLDGQI